MAVHCIEVFASTEGMSESEIQKAVSDWVDKNSEWLDDDFEHQVRITEPDPASGSGTLYVRGQFRFLLDDAKDNLLQKAADKLKNKIDWFRLVYHPCDHYEDQHDGCTPEERWNWEDAGVTVPADVEAIIPEPDSVVNA